jgi:hypothetical protein
MHSQLTSVCPMEQSARDTGSDEFNSMSNWNEPIFKEAAGQPRHEVKISAVNGLGSAILRTAWLKDGRLAIQAEFEYRCGDHKAARIPWIAFGEPSEGIRYLLGSAESHFSPLPSSVIPIQAAVQQEMAIALRNCESDPKVRDIFLAS